MRTIFKVGITVAVLFTIALAVYAASTYKDPLVYSHVKVTNISLQNWGDDFVYLSNGAVLRVYDASGLMIGHTYDVYQSWSGHYHFVLVN